MKLYQIAEGWFNRRRTPAPEPYRGWFVSPQGQFIQVQHDDDYQGHSGHLMRAAAQNTYQQQFGKPAPKWDENHIPPDSVDELVDEGWTKIGLIGGIVQIVTRAGTPLGSINAMLSKLGLLGRPVDITVGTATHKIPPGEFERLDKPADLRQYRI